MSRAWPIPPADRTLHCIGDTHFGGTAFTQSRRDIVADDLARRGLPDVDYRIQLGDLTDTSATEQDTDGVAWMESLGGTPLYVVGNHDMSQRTANAAMTAWGQGSKDYTRDLGYAQLIVIGPDETFSAGTGMNYFAPTLAWLDEQMGAATKPAIIAAHPPLMNTEAKLSNSINFSAQPDADVRTVLADHVGGDVPFAWISGHTHSPITTVDLAKSETVGGGQLLALNCSTLSHLSASRLWTDHLISFYLTVEDDRWDVRFRNHGAHQWVGGVGGYTQRRIWTMPFAA